MRILKLQLQAVLTILLCARAFGASLGNEFHYQGRLSDGGNPVNGNFDLRFANYDSVTAGSSIGAPFTNLNIQVSDGVSSTSLGFGAGVSNGVAHGMGIAVRINGGAL